MAKILILFGTNYGQTRKISEFIANIVTDRGHEVSLVQGNKLPDGFSPGNYDAAIIGTSIHMDTHQISIRRLVKQYQSEFNQIPVAYFCVCLTAYGTKAEDHEQVEKYVNDFIKYTGLEPAKTAAFEGALMYPTYNFVKRYVAKLVARRVGADTETKRELYEYTNWNAVTKFTEEFLDTI